MGVAGPGHADAAYAAAKFAVRGFTEALTEAQLNEAIPDDAQAGLISAGLLPENPSAEDKRQWLIRIASDFRDKAPLTAAQAAADILDGVRAGAWRILVGQDAAMIDERVRAQPAGRLRLRRAVQGLGTGNVTGTLARSA